MAELGNSHSTAQAALGLSPNMVSVGTQTTPVPDAVPANTASPMLAPAVLTLADEDDHNGDPAPPPPVLENNENPNPLGRSFLGAPHHLFLGSVVSSLSLFVPNSTHH